LPKFTLILQSSPTNDPGEFVNSLPPIKNPTTPLASGDTVSEPWFIEVASVGEVKALIQKQVEALNARVAALEAKLTEISPDPEPLEPQKDESAKSAKPEQTEPVKKEPAKKEPAEKESAQKKSAGSGKAREASGHSGSESKPKR
jgi:hypothetical protein